MEAERYEGEIERLNIYCLHDFVDPSFLVIDLEANDCGVRKVKASIEQP